MSAPTLAFKGVATAEGAVVSQLVEANESEGVVTAVVSVTGVVDEVDDVIEPGAYKDTLVKRRPKVCWHHAWEKPVGRVLHIEELLPGDRRLPVKTRGGQAWPKEAGALIATMQLNLKSERGREAFEAIRFYSESGECEWSIGYQVPAGKSRKDKKGIRWIQAIDLYELSFVLFGAHLLTGTLALKAAMRLMTATKDHTGSAAVTINKADFEKTLAQVTETAADDPDDDATEQEPADGYEHEAATPGTGTPPDPGGPADGDEVPLGVAGKALLAAVEQMKADAAVDTTPGDRHGNAEDLIDWYVHGEGAAKIRWPEKGSFDRCVRIAGKHMEPEMAKGFCANRHHDATGTWPGQDRDKKAAPAADLSDAAPPPAAVTDDAEPEHSGVMVAVYPDEATAEQIAVPGGDKPDQLHITLAYLGKVTDDVGAGSTLADATGRIVAAAQIAAATHEPLTGKVGGIGRFPDTGDGVPVWAPVDVVGLGALRESVVTALTDAGLPVMTDHGFTPHLTLGYNLDMSLIPPLEDVPVSFDKLVVAVGGARTEVRLGQDADVPASGAPVAGEPLNPPLDGQVKAAAYDPTIETGPDAGHRAAVPVQQKMFPQLEGTYEERQRTLEQALAETLLSEVDDDHRDRYGITIEGTWPDRVVVTVRDWTGVGIDGTTYEVSYSITEDGTVQLGEPEQVQLTVVVLDADDAEVADVPPGDMLPLAEMVETVAAGFKTLTGREGKAGRVLSASNAQRLRAAVEHLISVLAAAGIEVGDSAGRTGEDPRVDTETTAPSARDTGSKTIPADEVAAVLADLEAAAQEA